jgi:hypothetical protein
MLQQDFCLLFRFLAIARFLVSFVASQRRSNTGGTLHLTGIWHRHAASEIAQSVTRRHTEQEISGIIGFFIATVCFTDLGKGGWVQFDIFDKKAHKF